MTHATYLLRRSCLPAEAPPAAVPRGLRWLLAPGGEGRSLQPPSVAPSLVANACTKAYDDSPCVALMKVGRPRVLGEAGSGLKSINIWYMCNTWGSNGSQMNINIHDVYREFGFSIYFSYAFQRQAGAHDASKLGATFSLTRRR